MEQPIGRILDDLGVTANLDPNDRIVEVLVIAKIVELEGSKGPVLGTFQSQGADWISQRGLLHAALEIKGMENPERVESED